MKKFSCITVAILMSFMMGCGISKDVSNNSAVTETPKVTEGLQENVEELKNQISDLQSQVDDLKTQLSTVQTERDTLQAKINKKEDKKVESDDVTVKFTNMKSSPADLDNWKYSETVEFEITETNNTDKDIKGIQGVVDIQDMFGSSIMMIQCDLTNTVKAGETIIDDSLGMEINQFMDDHVKLYTSDYDDLIFKYKVDKILFTDGTSKGE